MKRIKSRKKREVKYYFKPNLKYGEGYYMIVWNKEAGLHNLVAEMGVVMYSDKSTEVLIRRLNGEDI